MWMVTNVWKGGLLLACFWAWLKVWVGGPESTKDSALADDSRLGLAALVCFLWLSDLCVRQTTRGTSSSECLSSCPCVLSLSPFLLSLCSPSFLNKWQKKNYWKDWATWGGTLLMFIYSLWCFSLCHLFIPFCKALFFNLPFLFRLFSSCFKILFFAQEKTDIFLEKSEFFELLRKSFCPFACEKICPHKLQKQFCPDLILW